MEKSVTFTGACANEINRSFVYRAKGWRHVRIRCRTRYIWMV